MRSDVALALLDPETLAHPLFAGTARAYWSGPLAEALDALLDAGVSVIGVDLIFPDEERVSAEWIRVIRRGAREGRIILGVAAGTLPAIPSPSQRLAVGGAESMGLVNFPQDADGVIRRVPAHHSLAAMVATRAGAESKGEILLAATLERDFITWSIADVIRQRESPALTEAFAGRAVIVGAWLPGEDHHLSLHGEQPGILLHAAAVDAWMHGKPLRPMRAYASVSLIMFMALLGTWQGVSGLLGRAWPVVPLLVFASVLAAWSQGWILPWLACVIAWATTAGLGALQCHAMTARRFMYGLPTRFRRYPDIHAIEEITVCFVDIASFTLTSEGCNPDLLADDLGRCLTTLEQIVIDHGGFVDKYLGDGLMALFGIGQPKDGSSDAVAAAKACLRCCTAQSTMTLAGHPVRLRIGIAAGHARVGTLGYGPRIHFTAIGDVVNIAARLEQMNRELGTELLVNTAVKEGAPQEQWRDCGERQLRGRQSPVHIWTMAYMSGPL